MSYAFSIFVIGYSCFNNKFQYTFFRLQTVQTRCLSLFDCTPPVPYTSDYFYNVTNGCRWQVFYLLQGRLTSYGFLHIKKKTNLRKHVDIICLSINGQQL
jgi:hypothetical protein